MKIILIISYCLSLVSMVKIQIDVKPSQTKCLGEYLIHNNLSLFEINAPNNNLSVKLHSNRGKIEYFKENESNVRIAFTARESEHYQLCITNTGTNESRYDFRFKTGVSAKDYSSIAKQSNLKPVDLNVSN